MTLDKTARLTAQRLIRKFGKTATLQRTTRTNDVATGKTTDKITTAAVKVSPPEAFRADQIDGTLVHQGDAMVNLAARGLTITPTPETDAMLLDSVIWRVVAVETVWSGDLPALFKLQLRK